MNSRSIKSLPFALLYVAAGSVLAWWLLGCPSTGIDDADIFFVYARHLAEGHGFVYNIGGERVEGFTSLLWTLVCAGVFRLTEQAEVPLYLLNLVVGAGTIWICLQRVRRPALLLLLLASVPAWFAWCQATLMETGLWCLLLTLSVLAVVDRRRWLLCLLLPLLVVTRPESMLWGAWLLLMFVWHAAASGGWLKGLKSATGPAIAFIAALSALIAFRMNYFGYPVPNTYYAKVTSSLSTNLWNGTGYLFEYLIGNPAVLLAAAAWLWIVVRGVRNCNAELSPSVVIALCLLPGIGIPVLVGGDHFGGSRFYQPIWPLLCLLVAEEGPRLCERINPVKVRIGLMALCAFGWVLFPFTARMKHEFGIAQQGRKTGQALECMFVDLAEYPTVATITAGGSKYAYPGMVLDLMGLNATEMAHAPGPRKGFKNHTAFNREVFYAWLPDIMLHGEDSEFDAYVLKGLLDEDRFKQSYIKIALQRNGREVHAYYSHEFLERVQRSRQ